MPLPPSAVEKLVARLRRDLGDRLREFPLEVVLDEAAAVTVVVKGAGESVTALRGLREKLQPICKRAVREVLGGGVRFSTEPATRGADLVVSVHLD